MADTVPKPITNGVNYTRCGSSAGANITAGGMNTTSDGMISVIGTTAITIAIELNSP